MNGAREARSAREPRAAQEPVQPVQPERRRWSAWRSVLAGAVIGFIDAAGSERERRALSRPAAVVRFDHRHPDAGAPPAGLWFLFPLRDVRRYLSRN